MSKSFLFVLMLAGLTAVGCGGSSESATETSAADLAKTQMSASTAELKVKLQEIASSGAGGSATMGIKETVEQVVRPTNTKLADELSKDLDVLSRSSDNAEIKTLATRMAGKL